MSAQRSEKAIERVLSPPIDDSGRTVDLARAADKGWGIFHRTLSTRSTGEQALVLALMEMVVNGVSTRKIAQITEELCGTSFSKSTVSSLCKGLDPMIQNWNQRFLHEHVYPFVLVDANSSSASSLNKLNKELEQIENRLLEIQQLQDKYMEAFEKNTLPIDILQERLQKVSNEKRELEQKKNEITLHLSSSDSKVIQPELIELLLEKFLFVYKQTSRENQKQLLQLLIDKITIKQTGKSRTIKNIELEFDFTEVNISKTFILIHMLYRKADNETDYPQPIPASDNKIPPYLQQFLPLFMIRFPPNNPKCAVNLFD